MSIKRHLSSQRSVHYRGEGQDSWEIGDGGLKTWEMGDEGSGIWEMKPPAPCPLSLFRRWEMRGKKRGRWEIRPPCPSPQYHVHYMYELFISVPDLLNRFSKLQYLIKVIVLKITLIIILFLNPFFVVVLLMLPQCAAVTM